MTLALGDLVGLRLWAATILPVVSRNLGDGVVDFHKGDSCTGSPLGVHRDGPSAVYPRPTD